MDLSHEFEVSVPVERAWPVLEAVAELSASLAVVLIPSWEQLVAGGFERRAGSVLGTGHWKRL